LRKELELVRKNTRANVETLDNMYWENVDLKKDNEELQKENAKLEKELYMAEQTIKDLNLTIRQYEKWFSNGSWLWDDLE
jgi:cell division protein FtsB